MNPRTEEVNKTGRKVFCVKFQKEMPGLDEVPFDNHPLGQRIYENVSKEAWKLWLEQMKMLMNEYRLNLGTQEAQEFLMKQMEDYFFGQGSGAAARLYRSEIEVEISRQATAPGTAASVRPSGSPPCRAP